MTKGVFGAEAWVIMSGIRCAQRACEMEVGELIAAERWGPDALDVTQGEEEGGVVVGPGMVLAAVLHFWLVKYHATRLRLWLLVPSFVGDDAMSVRVSWLATWGRSEPGGGGAALTRRMLALGRWGI